MPFGEKLQSAAANEGDMGFTGHINDATGLTYMQARFYDPVTGRFLSVEPVGFLESGKPHMVNRFAYTGNDPVNKIDPDGRQEHYIAYGNFTVHGPYSLETLASGDFDGCGDACSGSAQAVDIPTPGTLGKAAGIGAVKAVIKQGKKLFAKKCCFVAGTLVETEGGLRPIEDIKVGDKVWARNTETGETALKEVTDLIRRHERVIWEVSLSGQDGISEFFETTDDHPWWIVDEEGTGSWVTTENLRPGMIAISRGADVNAFLTLASVEPAAADRLMMVTAVTEANRTEATFNLTVADFHTYFVGESRVLVHNCNLKNLKPSTEVGDRVKTPITLRMILPD